jgi:branched-subunit amino acid aminotransferase/4-amino-4-deoxychorismate lyase
MEVGTAAGIPCEEAVLKDQDLFGADEAFFTSTTKEIVPIVQVGDRKIGNGTVGPVTKKLLAEYRKQADALSRRA